jgi:oligoribonuclease (3'-5' exoribonuclease)
MDYIQWNKIIVLFIVDILVHNKVLWIPQSEIKLFYLCSVIHDSIYGPKFGLLISVPQMEYCIHYRMMDVRSVIYQTKNIGLFDLIMSGLV